MVLVNRIIPDGWRLYGDNHIFYNIKRKRKTVAQIKKIQSGPIHRNIFMKWFVSTCLDMQLHHDIEGDGW